MSFEVWDGATWVPLEGELAPAVLETLSAYDEVACSRDGDTWTLAAANADGDLPAGCYVVRERKAREPSERCAYCWQAKTEHLSGCPWTFGGAHHA